MNKRLFMRKEHSVFLEHIKDSIHEIEMRCTSVSKEEFLRNRGMQAIAERHLEIIGEAVKNLPDDFKKKYPNIPWKDISGMRDIITHQYFGLDIGKIWGTVKYFIPELKRDLEILEKNESEF